MPPGWVKPCNGPIDSTDSGIHTLIAALVDSQALAEPQKIVDALSSPSIRDR
jgi:hypothetical protein